MAKFSMEPGERELTRTPPRWVAWTAMTVTVALPTFVILRIFLDDDSALRENWTLLYVIGGLTALQIPLLALMLRWRIMVTDRRILVRRGLLKRELEEIDRGSIGSVRSDGFLIRFEGDGRTIESHCHPFFSGRLMAAVDPSRVAWARPAGVFGGLLETGEEVLLRAKSQLPVALATIAVAFMPLVSSFNRILGRDGDLEPIHFVFLLGLPAAAVIAGAALMFAVARSQKQWMISGRRVLTVQGVFRRLVEEIPLDRIDGTSFDGRTLTVQGDGRRLDVLLGQVREDDLQRVLGRWFPWQGAPAGPAKSLLRDGEAIRLRRPRTWLSALGVGAPVAGIVGLVVFLGSNMPEEGFDFGFLTGAVLPIAALLLFAPQLYRELVWSVLVTDRRVLLRRRHDHTRYDDLPLDEIEEIREGDKDRPRVILRGGGREYEIPVQTAKGATLIRQAIETAKGEARWRA